MRTELYEDLIVPCWALSGLVNDDWSGVEDPEDEKRARTWLDGFGPNPILSVEDGEPGFSRHPEFGLACDCQRCTVLVPVGPNGITHEQVADTVKRARAEGKPLYIEGYQSGDGSRWNYCVWLEGPGLYRALVEEGMGRLEAPELELFDGVSEEVEKLKRTWDRITAGTSKTRAPIYTPFSDDPDHACVGVSTKNPDVLYLHDLKLVRRTPVCRKARESLTDEEEERQNVREILRVGLYVPMLKLTQDNYDSIEIWMG
jgi:hypothetical protein